jgi:hypothetical protein
MANSAYLSGMLKKSARLFCPVIKISSGTKQSTTIHSRVICGNTERERAASVVANKPNTARRCLGNHVTDRSTQVINPALHREITLTGATAAKCKRHRVPTNFTCNLLC